MNMCSYRLRRVFAKRLFRPGQRSAFNAQRSAHDNTNEVSLTFVIVNIWRQNIRIKLAIRMLMIARGILRNKRGRDNFHNNIPLYVTLSLCLMANVDVSSAACRMVEMASKAISELLL